MAKCSSVVLPNYGVQFALRFPGAFWSQVAHSTRDILVSCISLNRSEVDSIAQQRGYIRPPEPVQRPFLALTAFRFAPLAAPTIQFRLPDQYLERKKELAVRIPVFGSEDERLGAVLLFPFHQCIKYVVRNRNDSLLMSLDVEFPPRLSLNP